MVIRSIGRALGVTREDLDFFIDRAATLSRVHSVNALERMTGACVPKPKDLYELPIVINSFNRLDSLREQIAWLEKSGCKNITILDNASSYQPLLEYLAKTKHRVEHLGRNIGPMSLWQTDHFKEFGKNYYVYTDPDIIGVEECPPDFLEYFYEILRTHPLLEKIGFGLKLDDLPDHYDKKQQVLKWEQQFWDKPRGDDLYNATIDTTFAMYRPYAKGGSECVSIRSGGQYLARHVPWYSDSANPTEEDRFYEASIDKGTSHWMSTDIIQRAKKSSATKD